MEINIPLVIQWNIDFSSNFPAMTPQIKNVLQLGLGMANPFADVRTELQRKKAMPCLIVSLKLQLFKIKS